MSFSVELWDQFEEVYSKVTRGKDFSEKVVEFVRKRQLIEKEYAKKLQALTKSSEIEMGTLNDAWTQIKEETESIAKKHAELSESFGFQVADPVANHVREAKKRRQAGRKLIKDLAAAEQRAVAAKSSYESARRGQDDAKEKYDQACANNTVSPQNEKLMKKVKEAGKKAEKADQQYRAAVDACKATQDKYYDEEMPRVLAVRSITGEKMEFESCEKARIDCTKDALVNWVKLQESLAPEVQSACDRMHKSVNAIGAEADLRQFVNEKATHREKPPRCEYETYNQELQKCVGGGSSSSNSGRSVSSSRSSVPSSSRSAPSGAAHSQSSGSSSHAGQKKFHTLGQCRALHTYTATDPHELSFQVGDVIDILKKDASGWWQGALNGVVGVFPSVEWVEELAPGGAIGNVRALYDYTAETEFELTIRAGEVLHAEKEEEGWYCGTNSDNQYGRFPANYVERV